MKDLQKTKFPSGLYLTYYGFLRFLLLPTTVLYVWTETRCGSVRPQEHPVFVLKAQFTLEQRDPLSKNLHPSLNLILIFCRYNFFVGRANEQCGHFAWISREYRVNTAWIPLVLHIQDVWGSNLGTETGYSDRNFVMWFSSVPPGKGRDSTLN
jgi:hypothetical protein